MKYYLALILLLIYSHAFAEDWMGYVLRCNYQGRDYYWVYDDAFDKGEEHKCLK